DVVGINFAVGSDAHRKAPRDRAGAGTDIGDGGAFDNADIVERFVGLLLFFALRAGEPAGAIGAHYAGIFAAGDRVCVLSVKQRTHEQTDRPNWFRHINTLSRLTNLYGSGHRGCIQCIGGGNMKSLLRKLGIPAVAVAGMLALFTPSSADAR